MIWRTVTAISCTVPAPVFFGKPPGYGQDGFLFKPIVGNGFRLALMRRPHPGLAVATASPNPGRTPRGGWVHSMKRNLKRTGSRRRQQAALVMNEAPRHRGR